MKFDALSKPKNVLFSNNIDYIRFIEIVRNNPVVSEINLESQKHFDEIMRGDRSAFIPLLIRNKTRLQFITVGFEYQFEAGSTLAFIGNIKL